MIRSSEYLNVFTDRYKRVYSTTCNIEHLTITRILAELKSTLNIEYNLKKRIYSIVNELLENTLIHGSGPDDEVEIVILKNDLNYRVISFNITSIQESESLVEYSSNINTLTNTELKSQYKQKLLTGEVNEKGTIGVGMELIRMKSKNKILISTEESGDKRIIIIDVKIDI